MADRHATEALECAMEGQRLAIRSLELYISQLDIIKDNDLYVRAKTSQGLLVAAKKEIEQVLLVLCKPLKGE